MKQFVCISFTVVLSFLLVLTIFLYIASGFLMWYTSIGIAKEKDYYRTLVVSFLRHESSEIIAEARALQVEGYGVRTASTSFSPTMAVLLPAHISVDDYVEIHLSDESSPRFIVITPHADTGLPHYDMAHMYRITNMLYYYEK